MDTYWDLYIPTHFEMELHKDLGHFFIYESDQTTNVKCGSIHKKTLIPFLGPGSESQPESRWQVLPWYFVLIMQVPESFPRKGIL